MLKRLQRRDEISPGVNVSKDRKNVFKMHYAEIKALYFTQMTIMGIEC